LNDQAFDAFQRAVVRAAKLGSHRPEHFLFPFRVNRALWDPNRHASKRWLKRQGQKLRRATGIAHFKPHAFRHLAVTELLEAGVPEQTVIALAGWVGRKMLDTYSHTRIEAKNDAVKALEKIGPKPPAAEGLLLGWSAPLVAHKMLAQAATALETTARAKNGLSTTSLIHHDKYLVLIIRALK
jgi:hypothetical protein